MEDKGPRPHCLELTLDEIQEHGLKYYSEDFLALQDVDLDQIFQICPARHGPFSPRFTDPIPMKLRIGDRKGDRDKQGLFAHMDSFAYTVQYYWDGETTCVAHSEDNPFSIWDQVTLFFPMDDNPQYLDDFVRYCYVSNALKETILVQDVYDPVTGWNTTERTFGRMCKLVGASCLGLYTTLVFD
jgi:hypothetical protein